MILAGCLSLFGFRGHAGLTWPHTVFRGLFIVWNLFLVALLMSFKILRASPTANEIVTPVLMTLIFAIPAYPIIEIIAMHKRPSEARAKALVIDCFLAAGYVLLWFVVILVGSAAVI
jgi:hypothetical protein